MPSNNPFQERREFFRYQCNKPVQYKILYAPKSKSPAPKIIEGASKNLSASGILFATSFLPEISSIITMDLDYRTSGICREIEENTFIVNNTLVGKVVRIEDNDEGAYDIGVAFIKKTDDLPPELKSMAR